MDKNIEKRPTRGPALTDLLRQNIPMAYSNNGRSERFIRFVEETGHPLDQALGAYRKQLEGLQTRTLKDGSSKQIRYAAKTINSYIDAAVERINYALAHAPHLTVADKHSIEEGLKKQKKRIKIADISVPEDKILSNEELETFIAGIENPILACMARVLADTALRISEMLNVLARGDVQPTNGHYKLRIMGKGNKERFVEIEKEPIDRARELCSSKVYLFEKGPGVPYRREWVTMNLRRQSQKIIGRAIGAHVFRHTVLSYLAKKTGRIKAVANLAGHASPATTLSLYVHDKFTYEEQRDLLRERKGDAENSREKKNP